MNIRRFVATDMRAALAAIRGELGSDAVMLSSRKLPEGVEVIAAIDYDDSLLGNSALGEQLAGIEADDLGVAQLDEYQRAATPALAIEREITLAKTTTPLAETSAPESSMAHEIKDLRRLLETQLASLAWNDLNRQAPVRARLLRELSKLGVDSTIAAELADEVPNDCSSQEAMRLIMRRFGERLPLVTWDMATTGGIFAIVGPTGVGKTTSLAKIAARFVLKHSVDELGLISTDTYRIGARQQLANFARILRAPMHVAESAQDLRRVLDGFSNKKLVLIDTAGMSQRDVRLANQFTTLNVDGYHVRTVLAVSAGADRGCLSEAMNVFKAAKPEALIVTKLDEASALGGVLSLAIRNALPVAYLSDGQRVPEDLHCAGPKRFWLLHNALKLSANAPTGPDEHELAERFGHMGFAVNA
ncbi:MAG: flagellar biosynthesis protein FlhF [Gammaproteobacteria bacterium]